MFNSATLSILAFSWWTVTSYLCHLLAKEACRVISSNIGSISTPAMITFFQLLCCYATISMPARGRHIFPILALSHSLATAATNISLALMFSSSTLTLKLLEPVTSSVMQRLVLKTRMSVETVYSIVIIVSGAIIFIGNPFESLQVTVGSALALLSNVILGIRNIALKVDTMTTSEIHLRSKPVLFTFAAVVSTIIGGVFVLERQAMLPCKVTHFLLLSFGSSLCHVAYSVVSTTVILRCMTVVSHAIANIFKRVLVVLLLHASGQHHASLWNWVGLVLCTCGMLVYSTSRVRASLSSRSGDWSCAFTASKEPEKSVDVQDLTTREPTSVLTPPSRQHRVLLCLLMTSSIPLIVCFLPGVQLQNCPNYAHDLRFGHEKWSDNQILLKDPIMFQPKNMNKSGITTFLNQPITEVLEETDHLSVYLTKSEEVISEAQRLQLNLMSSLIGGKKYAILVGLAAFENKGDPAITVGQLRMLKKLNVELLYYIDEENCEDKYFTYAKDLVRSHSPDDLVILTQGGGNMIGYDGANFCRQRALKYFPGFQIIILSQSIMMRGCKDYVEDMVNLYCCNPNLTIVLRDRLSLYIAKRMFNKGTRLVLAPDMAFQVGPVQRFSPPLYDVLWLKRLDDERPSYDDIPDFPSNVTVIVADWWNSWPSPRGRTLVETAHNILNMGFLFLQRGRVVVTDRLHGHILSVLLDIPHVIVDNKQQKLSSYYRTWTRGLEKTKLADTPADAARLALNFLVKYGDSLPKVVSAMTLKEQILDTSVGNV